MDRNAIDINSNSGNRVLWLDMLRIIATVAVVVLHTAACQLWRTDLDSAQWSYLIFWDGLSRFGVPIFVMISGALLLNVRGGVKSSVSYIHKNRIRRMITVFVFWSIVYTIESYFHYNLNIYGVISAFIKGPTHLWYLFRIVGLYLALPLLQLIADSKYCKYFLRLCAIFSFAVPLLLWLAGLKSQTLSDIMSYPIDNLGLSIVGAFPFYFVFGYFLNNKMIGGKQKKIIYILSAASFVLTVLLTIVFSRHDGVINDFFFGNATINVALEAIGVYVFFREKSTKALAFEKYSSTIGRLSKYTFGVYLVHPLIISILDSIGISAISGNALILTPITAFVVLSISFLISALLNRIPIIKNYIV